MNDIYKYQHKFIGSSSVNIDDIIIRKYLNIKFYKMPILIKMKNK